MFKREEIDYSLYLVTDRKLSLGRSIFEIIEDAIDGGVTVVQLREKELASKEFYEEALNIKAILKKRHIPLIINDRVDIALAVHADGVHIGPEDLPLGAVRPIVGPEMIIGVSIFAPEEARLAEQMGADYLGLSPIFVTTTKPELNRQIGIEGIPAIRRACSIPLVGIGSMNATNAFEVISAGLDGVAVISGIVSQKDVSFAAKAIKAEIMRAKGLFLDGIAPGEL